MQPHTYCGHKKKNVQGKLHAKMSLDGKNTVQGQNCSLGNVIKENNAAGKFIPNALISAKGDFIFCYSTSRQILTGLSLTGLKHICTIMSTEKLGQEKDNKENKNDELIRKKKKKNGSLVEEQDLELHPVSTHSWIWSCGALTCYNMISLYVVITCKYIL